MQVFAYVTVEFKTQKNHLNQVVIWSRILQRVEDAFLREPQLAVEYPYALTDQGMSVSKGCLLFHFCVCMRVCVWVGGWVGGCTAC